MAARSKFKALYKITPFEYVCFLERFLMARDISVCLCCLIVLRLGDALILGDMSSANKHNYSSSSPVAFAGGFRRYPR